MSIENKTYLGDSVYFEYDGFSVILTTNNGGLDSNRIYLEPEVMKRLMARMIELGLIRVPE